MNLFVGPDVYLLNFFFMYSFIQNYHIEQHFTENTEPLPLVPSLKTNILQHTQGHIWSEAI